MAIQKGPSDGEPDRAVSVTPHGDRDQLLLELLDQGPTFDAALMRFRRKSRVLLGATLTAIGVGAAGLLSGVPALITVATFIAIFVILLGVRMPREALLLRRMRAGLADIRLLLEGVDPGA